jgi:hypothetical protein
MNNKIEPHYVDFNTAKLLKEKGFDELTTVWRQHGNGVSGDVEGKRDYYNRKGDVYISLPEQHQVVEWLRIKHGIWVSVGVGNLFHGDKFFILIKKYNIDRWELTPLDNERHSPYDTPQEAYSAAFDYILNNLI